jgi:hypothetical protein
MKYPLKVHFCKRGKRCFMRRWKSIAKIRLKIVINFPNITFYYKFSGKNLGIFGIELNSITTGLGPKSPRGNWSYKGHRDIADMPHITLKKPLFY